jgi:hypothetical protein
MVAQRLGFPSHRRDAILHLPERYRPLAIGIRQLIGNGIDENFEFLVVVIVPNGVVLFAATVSCTQFWIRHFPLETARRDGSGMTAIGEDMEFVRAAKKRSLFGRSTNQSRWTLRGGSKYSVKRLKASEIYERFQALSR